MKIDITTSNLENIISSSNEKINIDIDNKVNAIFSLVVLELAKNNSFISLDNVCLLPVNETFNRAFSSSVKHEYILGFSNLQIEINSQKSLNIFVNFFRKLKESYMASRENRKRNSNRKTRKNNKKNAKNSNFNAKKYNFMDLRSDIFKTLPLFLTTKTSITLKDNSFYITGEDIGVNANVVVHLMLCDSNQNLKAYNAKTSRFYPFTLNVRYENFFAKQNNVGFNFVNVLKILNTLYSLKTGHDCNQIFLESLLYNVPDELFIGDIRKVFLNCINYIKLSDVSKFKSIASLQTIYKDKLTQSNKYSEAISAILSSIKC